MASTTIHSSSEKGAMSDAMLQTPGPYDEKTAMAMPTTTPQSTNIETPRVVNADLGLKILQERTDHRLYVLEPALRKRVVRKLDFHILPILT
jgi:hypothetical protein